MKPRILITSGPTREYFDDVRYISNASSGLMGACLAAAALKKTLPVTVISGPSEIWPPERARVIAVVSAADMLSALKKNVRTADIIIGAAAVADYRPFRQRRGKMKKTGASISLELVENPDIIAWAGTHKRAGQIVGGFALETTDLRKRALKKLHSKNLDLIVANHASAIASRRSSASIIFRDGTEAVVVAADKTIIAERIIHEALRIWKDRQTR